MNTKIKIIVIFCVVSSLLISACQKDNDNLTPNANLLIDYQLKDLKGNWNSVCRIYYDSTEMISKIESVNGFNKYAYNDNKLYSITNYLESDLENYKSIISFNYYNTGLIQNAFILKRMGNSSDSVKIQYFNLANKTEVITDEYSNNSVKNRITIFNWFENNITSVENYKVENKGEWVLISTRKITYDNMLNPLSNFGFEYDYTEISDLLSFACKNNIISIQTYNHEGDLYDQETRTYEYENNLPVREIRVDILGKSKEFKYVYLK